jgi:hypothetical protein
MQTNQKTQLQSGSGSDALPCSPSFSRFDESWKKEVMKLTKSQIVDLLKKVCGDRDHAKDHYIALHNEVRETLMENLHLADGDVCTLKRLKDAIGFDLDSPENADVQP